MVGTHDPDCGLLQGKKWISRANLSYWATRCHSGPQIGQRVALWTSWTSLDLTLLRNPAGWAGTQPTGCLSAPARTFAAPAPWGWLGGFAMQGSTPDALSTIRCGCAPPSQPTRSEKRYPFATLPKINIPCFSSSSRTSAAQRREIRVASAPRAAKACYFGSPSRAKNAGAAHNKAAALVAEIGSSRRRS